MSEFFEISQEEYGFVKKRLLENPSKYQSVWYARSCIECIERKNGIIIIKFSHLAGDKSLYEINEHSHICKELLTRRNSQKEKRMKAKFKDIHGNIHELEVPEKKIDMNIEILGIGVTPHSDIYIFYNLYDKAFHLDLKHSLKFDGHLFSDQEVDTCDLLTNELETIKEELQDPKWKIILDKLARKTLLD